ncbi:hypothetical protein QBC39DRAFT_372098 [Podospora conica]|nr:hypothetical protein QBC39DRAFT_372098 [Schizothecium conicum]
MAQPSTQATFNSLLTKTHVQHALIQPDGRHNDLPTGLATLLFLNSSPGELQAVYETESASLGAWTPSPRSITDETTRTRFLGDTRFQRAYMTYFSMENGKFGGNSAALAMSHLLTGEKPLVYGLFSGLGRPLVFLSDGLELRSPFLVLQALTLSAIDWSDSIHELLSHPQLMRASNSVLPPDQTLTQLAYDGRLSGIMKAGPGFHGVSHVFSNAAAKAAVLEYVHQLDCRDINKVVEQLSSLSVLLVCATHKAGSPAFDFYLGCLPAWIHGLRILLGSVPDESNRTMLVRGVWLIMVLAYITQLRPVVDLDGLYSDTFLGLGNWEGVFHSVRSKASVDERYNDLQLLRALRSFSEFGKQYDGGADSIYLRGAWKLATQWKTWTGLGADREESLNIRL